MDMGPRRDLIGELAKAVRAHGMKFGVSNHGIENIEFIETDKMPAELLDELREKKADLFDPKWADFYNVTNRTEAGYTKFLANWLERNVELIDKYQPDMLWFDNGVDKRFLDPLKLWIAAYYYNRAEQWGKEVSISTKKAAFAPSDSNLQTIGSIIDFEKVGSRSPSGIRTGAWQVDDAIGSTWGYTSDMRVSSPATIIGRLIDTVSKNGTYLLNISPKPDGTIPQEQQDVLLEIGKWLKTNGEAIYGTHNWIRFSDAVEGAGGDGLNIRFTIKADDLYAIILGDWPGESVTIRSLAAGKVEGKVARVTMLGAAGELPFTQTDAGLHVQLPAAAPGKYAYTLKISGLKTNPSTMTRSGNPE
jgi:alpha-L-fucosidase